MQKNVLSACGLLASLTLLGSCSTDGPRVQTNEPLVAATAADRDILASVMSMADDYNAGLSEAIYLAVRSKVADPKARWLAQSFLRNGMGAALDIASGPNPNVSLLDLLVLSSLQTWAFREHWIPAGIGDAGLEAVVRLEDAESAMWQSAAHFLTPEQLQTVRELIADWIKANPDRTVVSLVRFEEFTSVRMQPSSASRGKATGLLKQITQATTEVDEVRLLGERALWYAGRYPYVLGQQAELTAYRMVDQPEVKEMLTALDSLRITSDRLSNRLDTLDADIATQREAIFEQITSEREATVESVHSALSQLVSDSMSDFDQRVAAQRDQAIDQAFDRLTQERKALLDDIDSRTGELGQLVTELKGTLSAGSDLAGELTTTTDAVDRLVAHFDRAPGDTREPLRIADLRDAASEARQAAENLTETLKAANDLAASQLWDQRLDDFGRTVARLVNFAFWRALALVLILVAGLGLVRLVPQRQRPTT